MNGFEKLIEDCSNDLYKKEQLASLASAFRSLSFWFRGDYIGHTKLNPKILVSDMKLNYQLLANLLVFLKKYYLPESNYAGRVHYRVHSTRLELVVGTKIDFQSISLLSSWAATSKYKIVDYEPPSPKIREYFLAARIPSEDILWSFLCTQQLLQAKITRYSKGAKELISSIEALKRDVTPFLGEAESIVYTKVPFKAQVVKKI